MELLYKQHSKIISWQKRTSENQTNKITPYAATLHCGRTAARHTHMHWVVRRFIALLASKRRAKRPPANRGGCKESYGIAFWPYGSDRIKREKLLKRLDRIKASATSSKFAL
ncbi:hypothetical protein BIW11_13770 [Tropilaelaps mercedesae]|uniref:Uncharacterized protein n=1 Tax=Tropilaelaps mercedesae TaxID=418985 RepID=A0A1V9X0P9_9ACAR|nr:hypothetical protein BIW11_13770 [Tropilaelaps mercedesae]